MRRYELMLVIRPDVPDDRSQAVIDRVTRQITASDPDDIVDDLALTSVTPANSEITLGATTPAASDGGTASATLSVAS